MITTTIDQDGNLRQDGLTADEWLAELFEFELCEECGRGADEHEVRLDMFGLFHAYCNHPADDGEE